MTENIRTLVSGTGQSLAAEDEQRGSREVHGASWNSDL